MESMDADFRMTGEEEMEREAGFGRDLIIRRMIGELHTCMDTTCNSSFQSPLGRLKSFLSSFFSICDLFKIECDNLEASPPPFGTFLRMV